MSIILICLIAISGVIELSFSKSSIAQFIAKAILLIFPIYILTDKDFKTKYPKAVSMRPAMIIITVVFIYLTVYLLVNAI